MPKLNYRDAVIAAVAEGDGDYWRHHLCGKLWSNSDDPIPNPWRQQVREAGRDRYPELRELADFQMRETHGRELWPRLWGIGS